MTTLFHREYHVIQLLHCYSYICRHLEGNELMENASFQSHAMIVMSTIGMVAENINNLNGHVKEYLMMLGAKHGAKANFSMAFMSMFLKCMETAWRRVLGEEYTEDVEQAWSMIFRFTENRLRDGQEMFALAAQDHNNGGTTFS